jgi:hypothetical protein
VLILDGHKKICWVPECRSLAIPWWPVSNSIEALD